MCKWFYAWGIFHEKLDFPPLQIVMLLSSLPPYERKNGCSTYFGGDTKTSFSSTQMIDHKWFWSENFGFVFWVLCLFYGPSFYRCKANGNAQEVEVEVTHWDLDLRPSPRCNMCAWDVFLSTPQRHFCHCHCMLVILPCCNIAPCQSDSLRADWVIRGLGSATK